MKTCRIVVIAVAIGSLTLAGSALGAAHRASATTVVTTKQTTYGTILVTGSGQTLYLDSADKSGHPACTGGCLSTWPPLKASGTLKAAGSAKSSLVATTKISGAVKQVTYAGHPLYTYASDSKSNPTSGQGISGFYVVSTSGKAITKSAAKPPASKPGY
jgi:predicted lipoprotein with Yx(FWY)xxD motif